MAASEDVFREDMLSELFVEEIEADLNTAELELKQAHNITLFLADLLVSASSKLPSGAQRDQVSEAQSANIQTMRNVGEALRAVRITPR